MKECIIGLFGNVGEGDLIVLEGGNDDIWLRVLLFCVYVE